jgi:hypothetical protein
MPHGQPLFEESTLRKGFHHLDLLIADGRLGGGESSPALILEGKRVLLKRFNGYRDVMTSNERCSLKSEIEKYPT